MGDFEFYLSSFAVVVRVCVHTVIVRVCGFWGSRFEISIIFVKETMEEVMGQIRFYRCC